jgi:hypothetical protein
MPIDWSTISDDPPAEPARPPVSAPCPTPAPVPDEAPCSHPTETICTHPPDETTSGPPCPPDETTSGPPLQICADPHPPRCNSGRPPKRARSTDCVLPPNVPPSERAGPPMEEEPGADVPPAMEGPEEEPPEDSVSLVSDEGSMILQEETVVRGDWLELPPELPQRLEVEPLDEEVLSVEDTVLSTDSEDELLFGGGGGTVLPPQAVCDAACVIANQAAEDAAQSAADAAQSAADAAEDAAETAAQAAQDAEDTAAQAAADAAETAAQAAQDAADVAEQAAIDAATAAQAAEDAAEQAAIDAAETAAQAAQDAADVAAQAAEDAAQAAQDAADAANPPPTATSATPNINVFTSPIFGGVPGITQATIISQSVSSVTNQGPYGIDWASSAWPTATWDGVTTVDPSTMTLAQVCSFIWPAGPDVMLGTRELYDSLGGWVDPTNPTPLEIQTYMLAYVLHFRKLTQNPTPLTIDPCLMMRALWSDERQYSDSWDAAYPGTCNSSAGPCVCTYTGSRNAHCGESFLPNAADQETYMLAAGGVIPTCGGGNTASGIASTSTDIPWSIKLSRVMQTWYCGKDKGHFGPFLGRETLGYHWLVLGNGTTWRGKWGGGLNAYSYPLPSDW